MWLENQKGSINTNKIEELIQKYRFNFNNSLMAIIAAGAFSIWTPAANADTSTIEYLAQQQKAMKKDIKNIKWDIKWIKEHDGIQDQYITDLRKRVTNLEWNTELASKNSYTTKVKLKIAWEIYPKWTIIKSAGIEWNYVKIKSIISKWDEYEIEWDLWIDRADLIKNK